MCLRAARPGQAVHNPHDPDAHFARKTKWVGYKVHVVESVEPESPAERKGEPGEHFITAVVTAEAAQDEMTGLDRAVEEEAEHHGFAPAAMYADAGYVTERTMSEAEARGMELQGPTRPDPHKGPYNSDAFDVDMENQRAVCPQSKVSRQWSRIRDTYMKTEYYRIDPFLSASALSCLEKLNYAPITTNKQGVFQQNPYTSLTPARLQ